MGGYKSRRLWIVNCGLSVSAPLAELQCSGISLELQCWCRCQVQYIVCTVCIPIPKFSVTGNSGNNAKYCSGRYFVGGAVNQERRSDQHRTRRGVLYKVGYWFFKMSLMISNLGCNSFTRLLRM